MGFSHNFQAGTSGQTNQACHPIPPMVHEKLVIDVVEMRSTGHLDMRDPTGFQNAGDVPHRSSVIINVFEHIQAHNRVHTLIRQRTGAKIKLKNGNFGQPFGQSFEHGFDVVSSDDPASGN